MEKADIRKFLQDVVDFAKQEDKQKNILSFICTGNEEEPNATKMTRFLQCVNESNAEKVVGYIKEKYYEDEKCVDKEEAANIIHGLVRLYPLTRPLVLRYFTNLKMRTFGQIDGFDFNNELLDHISGSIATFIHCAEGNSDEVGNYQEKIDGLRSERDKLEKELKNIKEANDKDRDLKQLREDIAKFKGEIKKNQQVKTNLTAEYKKKKAENEKEKAEVTKIGKAIENLEKAYKNNPKFMKELEEKLPEFPDDSEGEL